MRHLLVLLTVAVLLCGCGSPAPAAVLVYSANGTYATKTTLVAAAVAPDAAGKKVVFTTDQTLAANLAWPADRELVPENGAVINHGAYTISYAGSTARWPLAQIFNGTGAVTGLGEARPEWFGGLPDWNGATGTDCTLAIRKCVVASNRVVFHSGKYLLTDTIDITGRGKMSFVGIHRESIISVNSTATWMIKSDNLTTVPYRGFLMEGLSFFPATASCSLPSYILWLKSVPETSIKNNLFIGCSTVAQVYLDWVYVYSFTGNILSVSENPATWGAPYNTNAAGSGLYVSAEGHNGIIQMNRIRASDSQSTSAGIVYGGGDATLISTNAIESNDNNGIRFIGSSKSITIDANYFEGAQPIDINYTVPGTNYSHTISNNYHNAVMAVSSSAENNALRIINNYYDNMTTPISLYGSAKQQGVIIKGNNHNASITPYLFDVATTITDLVSPNLDVDDIFSGTGGAENARKWAKEDSIFLRNNSWTWDTGTGTTADAGTYFGGVQLYTLTATAAISKVSLFPPSAAFNASQIGRWMTIDVYIATSDARSQTVTIEQSRSAGGLWTRTYTLGTTVEGSAMRIYYEVPLLANGPPSIRFAMSDTASALVAAVPTVRFGLHSRPAYYDWR